MGLQHTGPAPYCFSTMLCKFSLEEWGPYGRSGRAESVISVILIPSCRWNQIKIATVSVTEKGNQNIHVYVCPLYANNIYVCLFCWHRRLLALVIVGSLWVSSRFVTPRDVFLAPICHFPLSPTGENQNKRQL